jgi:predicted metal-dependent HD superfamily phosphohydrolase
MQQFTASIETLKSSWESALQPFEVEPKLIQKVFLDLVRAYSSVGRFYHTLEHIQHILETMGQMRSLAVNFPKIQLAAWFHDVIYDSKAKDNEERSADYAVMSLTKLKIPSTTVERVRRLILSTKTHQTLLTDIDNQIFLDSDLAILGSSEWEYQVYAQAIRKEYSWLSSELYRTGRQQVLRKFLQRDRIYFTNQMFVKLEQRARENMQAELAILLS